MTIPLPRCWAPVPRQWRHVVAGDVIVAEDEDGAGALMSILDVRYRQAGILVDYLMAGRIEQEPGVDPDEEVSVLVPAVERDGMALLADTMGAHVISAPETVAGAA